MVSSSTVVFILAATLICSVHVEAAEKKGKKEAPKVATPVESEHLASWSHVEKTGSLLKDITVFSATSLYALLPPQAQEPIEKGVAEAQSLYTLHAKKHVDTATDLISKQSEKFSAIAKEKLHGQTEKVKAFLTEFEARHPTASWKGSIPSEPLDCLVFSIYMFVFLSTCWWIFRKVLGLWCRITCCICCGLCRRKGSKTATKRKGAPSSADAKKTPKAKARK